MFRTFITAAALVLAALSGSAQAQDRVQAGSLTCDVSAGIGLIIGSQRNVSCTFTPSSPAPIEYYTGTISKLGLDIGVTTGGVMVWLVFAPTNRPVGALQGSYAGASAEASVVAGVGANALVGGSEPHHRAAAVLGAGPGRPQPRGRRRRARPALGALTRRLPNFDAVLPATRPWRPGGFFPSGGTADPRPNVAAPCQSPRFPETILTGPPICGRRYGNGRQRRCKRPEVHCIGGPVPERQDHAARGDPRAHRRDPAPGHGRRRHHGRRRQQGSAPSQDERRGVGRHHDLHGRQLHLHRLPRLGRVRPRHARRAAGGRRRRRGVRGGREEGPATAAHPARARRPEDSRASCSSTRSTRPTQRVRETLQAAAAGLARAAAAAPDPDLEERHHHRLRRSRARARLCLQGARGVRGDRARRRRPRRARRTRASPCWRRSPITTTS